MRLYPDQMLKLGLAELLRAEGHDVIRAAEAGQSTADDETILQRAIDDERVLVTLDEHFGNWVVLPLSKHPGVVRLKVDPATTANAARILIPFLAAHEQAEFKDHLVIVSPSAERWVKTGGD